MGFPDPEKVKSIVDAVLSVETKAFVQRFVRRVKDRASGEEIVSTLIDILLGEARKRGMDVRYVIIAYDLAASAMYFDEVSVESISIMYMTLMSCPKAIDSIVKARKRKEVEEVFWDEVKRMEIDSVVAAIAALARVTSEVGKAVVTVEAPVPLLAMLMCRETDVCKKMARWIESKGLFTPIKKDGRRDERTFGG